MFELSSPGQDFTTGLAAETIDSLDRAHLLALLRLGDYSQDTFMSTDANGGIVYMNRSGERLFAYRNGLALGQPVSSLLPDVQDINQRLAASVERTVLLWRSEGIDKNQCTIQLFGAATSVETAAGINHLYVMRQRKPSQSEADRQAQLASLVYHNTSEGMLVLDPKGFIMDANPAFAKLRGRSGKEVIDQHVSCLNSPCHDREFYRAMWRSVFETGSWQGEHWGQHANGELYPEWLSINTSYDVNGEPHRRVMIFSNISEIKQAEAIIWKQANFDRLTNLPNRQMFHDRLEQSILKARRNNGRIALLFLDLDRFKEINDTLGHAVGDELLKKAAQRLSACVRQSDTVARLGGDEFTVLLDDVREIRDVERLTRKILAELSQPFHLGVETVFISTSIGITFYPDDAEDAEALLNNADQAMYAAKAEGRNRSCYFTVTMQEQAQRRMRLANDLHLALDQIQFGLDFQPIVDLASGRILKAETLLRWHHPGRGLVQPDEFIALAEETGIIRDIGNWVFTEATRQVAIWRKRFKQDIKISINISPVQLRNEGLDHHFWRNHLNTLGLAPEHVIVEITEGLLIDSDDSHITRQLAAFRANGIQVSIDDFGTGYSSLSYLSKFNIDFLKIDRSFVSNLKPSGPDLALCEAIILLSHRLGISVVAEGIENIEQYNLLRQAGCDFGQGYLFAHPMGANAFTDLLTSGKDLRPI